MGILWDLASIVELTAYIHEKKYETIPKNKEETAKLLYEQGNGLNKICELTGLNNLDVVWILHKEELLEFEEEMFKRATTVETETEKE